MLTHLGFLDSIKEKRYQKLENQNEPLTALKDIKNGKYLVAGVPAAPDGRYLHGCRDEYDAQEALSFYGKDNIIWYLEKEK